MVMGGNEDEPRDERGRWTTGGGGSGGAHHDATKASGSELMQSVSGQKKISIAQKRTINQDSFRQHRFENKLRSPQDQKTNWTPPYPEAWHK